MIQLIPATVVAEMFLVLCGQLLAIYAIVRTDACDALCCGLNSILLKKKRTRGIVYCPRPSSHYMNK